MEGGWVVVEMANLVQYVAKLIENEWLRYNSISSIVTGHVLNEEVDLQTLAIRLNERGIEPFFQDANGNISSPMLSEVSNALLTTVTQLFNE